MQSAQTRPRHLTLRPRDEKTGRVVGPYVFSTKYKQGTKQFPFFLSSFWPQFVLLSAPAAYVLLVAVHVNKGLTPLRIVHALHAH